MGTVLKLSPIVDLRRTLRRLVVDGRRECKDYMILAFPKQALISCTLSEIDFLDRSFPFSYGSLPENLFASLRQVGILTPPLLMAGTRGYIIVCGRRRLEAAVKVFGKGHEISAYLVAAGEQKEQLFTLAFWDNLAHRSFNLVEKADILVCLEALFDHEAVRSEFLPALEVPVKTRFIERYRAINALPESGRFLLAQGKMDGETVDLLKSWQSEEVEQLIELLGGMSLNRNKLKEIVKLFDDLAGRDRKTPAEIFTLIREEYPACLESAVALRRRLDSWMFPFLSEAENRFQELCRSLQLAENMRLIHPPSFEGNDYTLQINFRNFNQWQAACDQVAAIEAEKIHELFSR